MPVYTKLFIAFFFCVFFLFYLILYMFRKNVRLSAFFSNALLFVASVAFYAWDDVRFVPVLLGLGVITYVSGIALSHHSFYVYLLFMVLELGPIIAARAIGLFSSMGLISAHDLLVPLGLSFFTLQAFTYTDAVYKGKIKADRNLLNVMTFVCFFPCVSSGPIQRAEKLLTQIQGIYNDQSSEPAEKVNECGGRLFDYEKVTDGLKLIAWGLFKKLVIADNLAIYIQNVRGAEAQSGSALFLSAIFYSFQLYLDFSGYSDIVIGAARALGFDIGANFDHPYMSQSIGEFWRRWHISLSSWLRDFVYIPLGGSRVNTWKIYRNLLITFAVSGIWHGAGLTWIVWGLYHGAWLCLERAIGKRKELSKGIGAIVRALVTFVLVTFGWIIFSSTSMREFWSIISSFASIPGEFSKAYSLNALKSILMVTSDVHLGTTMLGLGVFGIISNYTYYSGVQGLKLIGQQKSVVRWCAYFALILAIMLFGAANSAEFIYNRF